MYAFNKIRTRTITTQKTKTDQSQAKDTDINVIVGRFLHTGTVPAPDQRPFYGDFSELPGDLRGFLDRARTLEHHRKQLPKALQHLTTEELLTLTPKALKDIMEPPAPTPAPTPATPPEGATK